MIGWRGRAIVVADVSVPKAFETRNAIKKSTQRRGFYKVLACVRFCKTSQDNKSYLDVEQEVHHIAIFNDVLFTF